jgi:hypothetical protein
LRLEKAAARHGVTVQQVALAALLAASPVMLPIPGTGSLTRLEENVGAASIRLTPEDIADVAGEERDVEVPGSGAVFSAGAGYLLASGGKTSNVHRAPAPLAILTSKVISGARNSSASAT